VTVTLHGKRDFANGIKLWILDRNVITRGLIKREAGESESKKKRSIESEARERKRD